jgi:hypothetical protein
LIRNKSVINKSIVNNNIISKRIMNKSIINRSMIIKSNTTFFIYTIVINDSKVFINKTESLRYLGLFSLAPLSSLRGRRALILLLTILLLTTLLFLINKLTFYFQMILLTFVITLMIAKIVDQIYVTVVLNLLMIRRDQSYQYRQFLFLVNKLYHFF